jgi:hypothetical protein
MKNIKAMIDPLTNNSKLLNKSARNLVYYKRKFTSKFYHDNKIYLLFSTTTLSLFNIWTMYINELFLYHISVLDENCSLGINTLHGIDFVGVVNQSHTVFCFLFIIFYKYQ